MEGICFCCVRIISLRQGASELWKKSCTAGRRLLRPALWGMPFLAGRNAFPGTITRRQAHTAGVCRGRKRQNYRKRPISISMPCCLGRRRQGKSQRILQSRKLSCGVIWEKCSDRGSVLPLPAKPCALRSARRRMSRTVHLPRAFTGRKNCAR